MDRQVQVPDHSLVCKTISGESVDVSTDVTKSWQKTRLKEIMNNYQPADIKYGRVQTGVQVSTE